MTLHECISRVDTVKPNQYSTEDKVRWLSYLDGSIKNEIIDRHEHPGQNENTETMTPEEMEEEKAKNEFVPYSPDRLTDELIAPFPYDEMYVAYLKAKIDEENGETARYNNTASTFNGMLSDFARAYHREHKPINRNFMRYV